MQKKYARQVGKRGTPGGKFVLRKALGDGLKARAIVVDLKRLVRPLRSPQVCEIGKRL